MPYPLRPKRNGWQTTSTDEISSIASRFGGGAAPQFEQPKPQNRFKTPITWQNVGDPENDRLRGGLPSGNGLVASDRSGDVGNQIAGFLAQQRPAPVTNTAPSSAVGQQLGELISEIPSAQPGGALNAQQRWMEEGGSQRTWNRAGVAMGVRSRIDARSRPDVRGSTASDEIRAGWGWKKSLPY